MTTKWVTGGQPCNFFKVGPHYLHTMLCKLTPEIDGLCYVLHVNISSIAKIILIIRYKLCRCTYIPILARNNIVKEVKWTMVQSWYISTKNVKSNFLASTGLQEMLVWWLFIHSTPIKTQLMPRGYQTNSGPNQYFCYVDRLSLGYIVRARTSRAAIHLENVLTDWVRVMDRMLMSWSMLYLHKSTLDVAGVPTDPGPKQYFC